MIFSSYVRNPLAELLDAVAHGEYDTRIPACGRVIKAAIAARLLAREDLDR